MQSIFNRVACLINRRNTGFGECQINPKLIRGGAYVPSTFKLSVADLATPATAIAALMAAAHADNPANRIYPIHGFVNPQDNTDAATKQTFSDGSEVVVREGLVKWMWQFVLGGLALHMALRTHNENGGHFIFWDSEFRIYGLGKNREIFGIPLNYKWVKPWKQNTGSNVAEYTIEVAMYAEYVNDNIGHAKLNIGLDDVKGLRDVDIVVNDWDSDTGLANVSLLTTDSNYNLYELYSTNFSGSGKALWTAVNQETGGDITRTSVTAVPGDKSFNVQLNVSDADYPTDGIIVLDLVAPSVLKAAGVEGFEAREAELEVGGS